MAVAKEGIPLSKSEHIEQSPDKLSGKPVFKGTRVPVSYLFDFLEAGESVEVFFEQFPMSTQGKNNVRGFLKELHEVYD